MDQLTVMSPTTPIRSEHAIVLVTTLPGLLVVHGAADDPNDRASLINLVGAIEHGCKQSPDAPWRHYFHQFGAFPCGDTLVADTGSNKAVQEPPVSHASEQGSDLKLTFSNFESHIEADFAWAVADVEAEVTLPVDGRKIHGQGCETFLFRRERNRWKVVHTHGSPRPGSGD